MSSRSRGTRERPQNARGLEPDEYELPQLKRDAKMDEEFKIYKYDLFQHRGTEDVEAKAQDARVKPRTNLPFVTMAELDSARLQITGRTLYASKSLIPNIQYATFTGARSKAKSKTAQCARLRLDAAAGVIPDGVLTVSLSIRDGAHRSGKLKDNPEGCLAAIDAPDEPTAGAHGRSVLLRKCFCTPRPHFFMWASTGEWVISVAHQNYGLQPIRSIPFFVGSNGLGRHGTNTLNPTPVVDEDVIEPWDPNAMLNAQTPLFVPRNYVTIAADGHICFSVRRTDANAGFAPTEARLVVGSQQYFLRIVKRSLDNDPLCSVLAGAAQLGPGCPPLEASVAMTDGRQWLNSNTFWLVQDSSQVNVSSPSGGSEALSPSSPTGQYIYSPDDYSSQSLSPDAADSWFFSAAQDETSDDVVMRPAEESTDSFLDHDPDQALLELLAADGNWPSVDSPDPASDFQVDNLAMSGVILTDLADSTNVLFAPQPTSSSEVHDAMMSESEPLFQLPQEEDMANLQVSSESFTLPFPQIPSPQSGPPSAIVYAAPPPLAMMQQQQQQPQQPPRAQSRAMAAPAAPPFFAQQDFAAPPMSLSGPMPPPPSASFASPPPPPPGAAAPMQLRGSFLMSAPTTSMPPPRAPGPMSPAAGGGAPAPRLALGAPARPGAMAAAPSSFGATLGSIPAAKSSPTAKKGAAAAPSRNAVSTSMPSATVSVMPSQEMLAQMGRGAFGSASDSSSSISGPGFAGARGAILANSPISQQPVAALTEKKESSVARRKSVQKEKDQEKPSISASSFAKMSYIRAESKPKAEAEEEEQPSSASPRSASSSQVVNADVMKKKSKVASSSLKSSFKDKKSKDSSSSEKRSRAASPPAPLTKSLRDVSRKAEFEVDEDVVANSAPSDSDADEAEFELTQKVADVSLSDTKKEAEVSHTVRFKNLEAKIRHKLSSPAHAEKRPFFQALLGIDPESARHSSIAPIYRGQFEQWNFKIFTYGGEAKKKYFAFLTSISASNRFQAWRVVPTLKFAADFIGSKYRVPTLVPESSKKPNSIAFRRAWKDAFPSLRGLDEALTTRQKIFSSLRSVAELCQFKATHLDLRASSFAAEAHSNRAFVTDIEKIRPLIVTGDAEASAVAKRFPMQVAAYREATGQRFEPDALLWYPLAEIIQEWASNDKESYVEEEVDGESERIIDVAAFLVMKLTRISETRRLKADGLEALANMLENGSATLNQLLYNQFSSIPPVISMGVSVDVLAHAAVALKVRQRASCVRILSGPKSTLVANSLASMLEICWMNILVWNAFDLKFSAVGVSDASLPAEPFLFVVEYDQVNKTISDLDQAKRIAQACAAESRPFVVILANASDVTKWNSKQSPSDLPLSVMTSVDAVASAISIQPENVIPLAVGAPQVAGAADYVSMLMPWSVARALQILADAEPWKPPSGELGDDEDDEEDEE